MIEITPNLAIDENELQFSFIRGSGPGGQNVNKVATAVQLRYDLQAANLPEDVRQRLIDLAGSRVNANGVLIIEARQQRQQELNRQEALQRLIKLVRQATKKPKRRKKTQPSRAARQRRLGKKRQRGSLKKLRQQIQDIDQP